MALHNSLAHVSNVYYRLSEATGLIVNYFPQPRSQKLEKALGTRLYFNCFPVRRLEAKVNCKESLFCLVRGVRDTKATREKKKNLTNSWDLAPRISHGHFFWLFPLALRTTN